MNNTIPLSVLRAFAPLASAIAPNPLLPICDYVKIEFDPLDGGSVRITKNNGNAFVQAAYADGGGQGSMLVDEKILLAFVDQAETDSITLTASQTAVTLQSGAARCSSPTEPVANYLNNDTPDGDGTLIQADLAAEIATAAAFIKEEEIPTPRSLVFVGEGHVAACGGEIGYFSPAVGAPQLILRRAVAQAVGALGACTHLENASYDFFRTADVTMGFVKSDIGFSREKLSGAKNYLYKPILHTEYGIFYDTLKEAGDAIGMDRRMVWQNISGKAKKNRTPFVYA